MLSRTADHMYWMSRYIERAESLARLVDAHYRMSLLPHSGETLALSLSATMRALHMEEPYRERHDSIEPRAVFEFVSLDREFSGSIFSCLRAARENARAVRGSLTSELWETLNSTWLDVRALAWRNAPHADIGQFVEWVKERSHLTRGVTIGTMLRDEAFHFTRIGTFLERADSTGTLTTIQRWGSFSLSRMSRSRPRRSVGVRRPATAASSTPATSGARPSWSSAMARRRVTPSIARPSTVTRRSSG